MDGGGTPQQEALPETPQMEGQPSAGMGGPPSPIPPTQPDPEEKETLEGDDGEGDENENFGLGGHDSEPKENHLERPLEFDKTKPPPKQLSRAAVDKRLRRTMQPRADGTFLVPECVREKWKDLGTRSEVMSMFEKAGYDSAP